MQTPDSSLHSESFDSPTISFIPYSYTAHASTKGLTSSLQCSFEIAQKWIGTPYHSQASLQGIGCDCAGLIKGIWAEKYQIPVPYVYENTVQSVSDKTQFEVLENALNSLLISKEITSLATGDVMLFRLTVTGGLAHTGIVTPLGGLIHAIKGVGVIEEKTLPSSLKRRLAGVWGWRLS